MSTLDGTTPGPWRVEGNRRWPSIRGRLKMYPDFATQPEGVGPLITEVQVMVGIEEGWANASLIAAAPTLAAENERLKARVKELEEVLKPLLDDSDHGQPCDSVWLAADKVLRGSDKSAEQREKGDVRG